MLHLFFFLVVSFGCLSLQLWYETGESSLQLAGLLCLDVDDLNNDGSLAYPRMMKCHYSGGSQEWRFMGAVSSFCS